MVSYGCDTMIWLLNLDILRYRYVYFRDVPLLRDLTWHIDTSRWIIWGDTATNSPQLPSLRRLHLWGTPIPRDQISYVTVFTKAAPQMAHLRLSGVFQFGELPHILAAALEPEEAQPSTHEAALRVELPKGLEQLIVQSSLLETSPGRNGWCGTGAIVHATMERNLLYIAWKYDKMRIAPACHYTIDHAREDWYDSIEGGDGCWRNLPRKYFAL